MRRKDPSCRCLIAEPRQSSWNVYSMAVDMCRNRWMEGPGRNGLTGYAPGRPVGDLAVASLATALRHFGRGDVFEVGSRTVYSVTSPKIS